MSDSERFEAKKGLEGVVFDTTTVSHVVPEQSLLYYRGYPVNQLAEKCCFEEVAYLLLFGELPTMVQLDEFCRRERGSRCLSPEVCEIIQRFPSDGHPMDAIRTCVSLMGMQPRWSNANEADRAREVGIALLAQIPTAVAAFERQRRGRAFIEPRADLSFAANFFHMCQGVMPEPEVQQALDGALTLYAEHGFNASTFTARVIASTQSDLCGAVSGAIAALKGPLHGGANEAVMLLLQEIGEPGNVVSWLDDALAKKRKIMGFGHRVYRWGDSRVPTMTKYRDALAQGAQGGKGEKWLEISKILETELAVRKNIHPNLDFPAGPAFFLMGFAIDLFTPIFVMSRVTGWTAHVAEQLSNNRLVRPLAKYIGPAPRSLIPIEQRQ